MKWRIHVRFQPQQIIIGHFRQCLSRKIFRLPTMKHYPLILGVHLDLKDFGFFVSHLSVMNSTIQ